MAVPNLTEVRQFRDVNGVRWRAFITRKVERWDPNLKMWVESNYTVDQLENDPDIAEFGGL